MNHLNKFIFIFALISCLVANAETLGDFRLHSMSLGTSVESVESQNSGFDLDRSFVAFAWKKTETLSGLLAVGTADFRKPLFIYPRQNAELALTELHLDLGTESGDFSFGLIRLPFGYEGYLGDGKSLFPESAARKLNFYPDRDYGVQFRSKTSPFFTIMSAHNGEGGPSQDPYIWFTGLWGIADEGGWRFLISGTTGQSSDLSTTGAVSPITFDPLVKAKVHEEAASLGYDRDGWQLVLEYMHGELIQKSIKTPYSISRFDFAAPLSEYLHFLLRYEQLDPEIKVKNNETEWSTAGVSLESTDHLLRFSLVGYKKTEKGISLKDDGAIASIRLNSWF